MANSLYDYGRQGILDRTIDMTGDVRVILIKTGYTFSNTHEYLTDLPASSYDNGRSATLASHTYAAGVFNAANTSITATAAVVCIAVALYQYNASDAAARLIAYIDTPASGLPCTPAAGQTVNINWDTGTNKIFKL